MTPELSQRLNHVLRTARAMSWDEMERTEVADGWQIKFRPAGQLQHPDVIASATAQLGLALAPYQTRMVSYISRDAGGPAVVMLVPAHPVIVTPAP